jgi:ATP-binding cassette subfamily B protein
MRPDVIDVTGAKRLVMKDGSRGAEIEFKDVTFKYPGETSRGIHGVSFKCKRGTKTAIVGHTGAGKTTISRLLFRFYDLASGEITIDGQKISQVTQSSLRHAVGVVPQDTVLFNESIRFNICYGKVCAESAEINAAAKGAHIYDFIVSLSKQWDTEVGERGLKLSGGEKQRVAIARCLLKDPPIVVLDEATSALDSITERTIQDALVNLTKGRTQLVIAHRLSTIQDADQIIVLKNGLVHERGTHDELLALDGEYAASWDAQLKDDVVTEPRSIEVKEEED